MNILFTRKITPSNDIIEEAKRIVAAAEKQANQWLNDLNKQNERNKRTKQR